ncbi:MAG TPA: thymidine phosphorylase [Gemmataceae bacterium]|jgi:pyrimidine-nucleoside phosphorylase|nr:thymidine phosphorylase [Gemmataceae bacterium]
MRAVDVIRAKRDGRPLSREQIEAFVHAATYGSWPDYQLAALLMAIWLRGMSDEETAWLTGAMANSGAILDLSDIPGPKVDKHSTGGVGDKTSLILAPLAAACGVVVPMMSGRGLGHTGGTLDKLEAIPGFRVNLTVAEFPNVLRAVGAAMIGQTAEVAPADRKLYALRDVTGTVESIPLITASILSKKIAEGIDGLVMDVKCGRGAFMKTKEDARKLALSLVANGRANGLRTEALITAMDAPLGLAVGNALEVRECIDTLRGQGPADLENLSVELAARMVRLGGLAPDDQAATAKVRDALSSGRGLEVLRRLIEQQGGDPRVVDDPDRLPSAPHRETISAERDGFLTTLDAEAIGHATMVLGAGRERVEHAVDPAVGAVVMGRVGARVRAGEPLVELHYRDAEKLSAARSLVRAGFEIGDEEPTVQSLILEVVA